MESSSAIKNKILLVEDDLQLLQLLAEMLHEAGYRVTQASDGKKALQLLSNQNGGFDLLVSDIDLPEVNGINLARNARRLACPVILMSGKHNPEDLEDHSIHSAFLMKPFSSRELLSTIQQILGS